VYQRRRNIVTRADGRVVNVARPRGQLFVCATGCCCGRTDDGFAAVPGDLYHHEWERRRLRNVVHLTSGGCLGPCALANVVLLLFDGQAQWFHSIDDEALVLALYDHVDAMLDADRCLPPPPALAPRHFTASAWQPRPDGQPVDDYRRRRHAPPAGMHLADQPAAAGNRGPGDAAGKRGSTDGAEVAAPGSPEATAAPAVGCRDETSDAAAVARLLAHLDGAAALPRRNGELVFEEPWQGRVFGMAVALHEQGLFAWEEFRQELIASISAIEATGGPFDYYEAWLGAFERLLATRGLVGAGQIEETTFQFEFGERGD
jgi:nitrile hydratase accessory protein